jgi:hypothetical protein
MDDALVVGRAELAQQIADSTTSLNIIVGDSGVGKTTLLETIHRVAGAPGPEYVRVRPASTAAIKTAIIDYLAQTVEQFYREDPSSKSAATSRQALKRLSRGLRQHTEKRSFEILVSAAEARYGKEAAAILPIFRDSLRNSSSDTITSRIGALRPIEVLHGVTQLAAELASILGRPFSIVIDDVQLCDDQELRQLGEFAAALPPAVKVFCSFTATTSADEQRLHNAFDGTASTRTWRVEGLSISDIGYLLSRAGVSTSLAPYVRKATDGYALHVVDAIKLLADGADTTDLEGLGRNEIVVRNTQMQLASLQSDQQRAVRLLAGFTYAITDQHAQQALSISAVDWDVLKSRLLDVGIFLRRPDQAWFHELRRVAIWSSMGPTAQEEVAVIAARSILNAETVRTDDVLTLASHLDRATPDLTDDTSLAAVLALSNSELAVMASILELAELATAEESNRFVNVDWALLHSRSFASDMLDRDLIDAVESLAEKHLIIYAANDNGAVATPYWTFGQGLIAAARSYRTFGKLCYPGLATYISQALRLEIGEFRWSSHSVGRESLQKLSQTAQYLGTMNPDGSRHIGRRDRPALLIHARFGDLDWSAAIAYSTEVAATRAETKLRKVSRFVGQTPLKVEAVRRHPLKTIPARLFVSALELLLGEDLDNAYSRGRLSNARPVATATSAQMAERSALRDIVREACSQDERAFLDLENDEGLFFEEVGEGDGAATLITVRVAGASGARQVSGLTSSDHGPYRFIRLAAKLGLQPYERITTIQTHWGRQSQHHLADELEHITLRAHAFNKAQDPFVLVDDAGWLETQMSEAAIRQFQIAQIIAARMPALNQDVLEPSRIFIRVADRKRSQWDLETVGVEAYKFQTKGMPSIHVVRHAGPSEARPTDPRTIPPWVAKHPDFEAERLLTISSGGVGIIAEILGYYEDEVDSRIFVPDYVALQRTMLAEPPASSEDPTSPD